MMGEHSKRKRIWLLFVIIFWVFGIISGFVLGDLVLPDEIVSLIVFAPASLFLLFMEFPILAVVPAIFFLISFIRFKGTVVLITSILWFVYVAYEYYLSTIDSIAPIRLDIFLIGVILFVFSGKSVVAVIGARNIMKMKRIENANVRGDKIKGGSVILPHEGISEFTVLSLIASTILFLFVCFAVILFITPGGGGDIFFLFVIGAFFGWPVYLSGLIFGWLALRREKKYKKIAIASFTIIIIVAGVLLFGLLLLGLYSISN